MIRAASWLLVAFAPPAARAADLPEAVRNRWATETYAMASLALPDGLPDTFSVTLEHGGLPVTLDLERRILRAPAFRLRVFADGVTRAVPAPEPMTYQGIVRGDDASAVGGALTPAGLSLRIFPSLAPSWAIQPLASVDAGSPRASHLVLEGGDWPLDLGCGVDDAAVAPEMAEPGAPAAHRAQDRSRVPWDLDPRDRPAPAWCGTSGMKMAQVAFDVDQVYYRNLGSDIAAVTANVEGHLAAIDAFYARDALITYELTDLVVRTTDFYLPDATNSLLDLFRNEWNANQTAVVRDIAHLMTGQPAPGLAGLAFVGVTCNLNWCYGWSVDSSGVLGHELGHNWSAGHCHDAAPCNNMCGACLYIGPNTKDVITRFRDSRTCLDDVPPHVMPVAPYAHPDTLILSRDEAVSRLPVSADVLLNDHDANCDDVTITSFEAASARGGSVTLNAGSGPAGRDMLVYTPPCMLFAGADTFMYTIGDGSGMSSTARVSVDIGDPGLVGMWTMDDATGSVASDATGWRRDAALAGAPAWVSGRYGGALELNGVDQHGTVSPLNLAGLPVTITGWVRRTGNAASFAGIVFSRAGSTIAGLHVGDANDLRYTWSDDPATWGRSSGLVLPDGAWAFVALVVEADRATIRLDDGASWRSWENVNPHAVQRFDGVTQLGWDSTSAARHLAGALDDVRVHDAALDDAELQAMRDGSSRAVAPRPADGSYTSEDDVTLAWQPAPAAIERDVYFGTDFDAVRTATPASPEHAGRIAATSINPAGLLVEGFTYAWRVDEVVAGAPVIGDTWIFTFRGRSPRLLHYWMLDEGAGLATVDGVGGSSADLRNGAGWTTGPHGAAVALDGADDVVAAALPGGTVSELTLSAWIRTSGTPAPWAGLVFTRGGGSATGLGLRDTAELGYHWGGGQWGWSSGLAVPLDRWIFVAASVQGSSATLYVDDGTGMRSATNAAGHGVVPWTGELLIGRDPWGAARSFAGDIDDVRIHGSALGAAEIQRIRDEPSLATNPSPANGEARVAAPSALSWIGGADVLTHELYVGDAAAAVGAADPSSPEFRGSLAAQAWTPPGALLVPGRTWYWRVDQRTGSSLVQGVVWRFLLTGDVGDSLRIGKSATGSPLLTWQPIQGTESFAILRCAPPVPGECAPSIIATAAGSASSHDDMTASAPLLWYQVVATPCLP